MTEYDVRVQTGEIAIDELLGRARRSGVGGIVLFDGIVRDDDCEALELEAYEPAAVAELERIAHEAAERHDLAFAAVVHRTGRLPVGANILVIVAAAGHRAEAFAACREILEAIKAGVPIWKKEYGPGGDHWVRGEHWPESGD